MVVDDVCEVVGREAVRLEQDLVVDVVVREGDVAAKLVAKAGFAFHGDLEANDGRAAFGFKRGDLCGR